MSYLKNLAQIFAREVGDNLKNYVFVFPNQRAGLFFRRDLGIALGKPTLSPQIQTINECFYSLTDTQLADPIDLLLRVARIHNEIRAEQHLDPEPLEQFLFWGKMILSDFNEVDNHLVPDVAHFFENIHDLHTIDSHFSTPTPLLPYSSTPPLYEIYTRLQASLRADGLAYDGMLHREVIERLKGGEAERQKGREAERSLSAPKNYVFIGFNALTTSEEQLLLYFKQRGQADFYFDYSDALVTDTNNRSSLFMEHNRALFPSKYDISSSRPISPSAYQPQYHYIEVNSTVAEAQEVHRILERLKGDLTRTAVVLPDERLLIPLLHTLPETIDKVNVTMGYPLSATPTYALISLVTDLQKRMTEAGFYHKDVTAILSHPYVHRLSPEACDAIKQNIVKRNRIYVDAATFAKDEYLSLIFSTEPSTWREILNHFPDDASEAVYKVQTVLNRIDRYLGGKAEGQKGGKEPLSLSATLNLMLSAESIAYTGEPLEGLQIMGILETRALDFDNIILTGFNDDLYPGNSITNSFIPYEVRCEYKLPTAERKDAIFAYNFYRMISYAKNVWFIANTRADEQHSGEPSRYLYQLQYQFGKPIHHYAVVDRQRGGEAEGNLSAFQPISLSATLNSFSPSGLNSYLRCPRAYYWHYVCGIEEPQEVQEDIDPRELGSRLHLLLQNFYEPFCGKTVTKEDIEKMLREIGGKAEGQKGGEVIAEYARLILERDLALAPFTYIATEQPRRMDLTLEDGSVVTLKGTIDRVDTLSAYLPRIIDYKTGSAKLEFSSVASLFDPEDSNRNSYALQTILYAILYGGGEPHIYGVRSLAQSAETAVHQKGQEVVDVAQIKEEFMGHVRRLITEIRDPKNEFEMTQDAYNKCTTCAFAKLCGR